MSVSGGDQEVDGVPPPAAPPQRRSRLRRALRASAVLALVVFLPAVLGLVFLHTPPGRTAMRVLVETWGSSVTGGTLRLGQLELALWKGHAAATAVSLALPDTRIEAQRIALDWSPAARAATSGWNVCRPTSPAVVSAGPGTTTRRLTRSRSPWRRAV